MKPLALLLLCFSMLSANAVPIFQSVFAQNNWQAFIRVAEPIEGTDGEHQFRVLIDGEVVFSGETSIQPGYRSGFFFPENWAEIGTGPYAFGTHSMQLTYLDAQEILHTVNASYTVTVPTGERVIPVPDSGATIALFGIGLLLLALLHRPAGRQADPEL